MVAQVLSSIFFIGLFFIIAGEWLFEKLNYQTGLKVVRFMKENQMYTFMILFGCNMAAANLMNTGAFEVYYDEDLVFSKLATGALPDVNELAQQLRRH